MIKIKPQISVIMPTYNGDKYISKAIESVLGQTFSDIEFIIINDGSIDDSLEIIKEYSLKDKRIIILNNEINLGIQKSLNRGLHAAQGKYIARIDADDVWINPNKLQHQFNFLELNPGYVLVGTGARCVDENSNYIKQYLKEKDDYKIRKTILGYNCFIHSSVLFNKKQALMVGGYSEESNERHVEDYDLWLKLGTLGKMHNLQSFDVEYMIRKDSLSNKNQKEQIIKTISVAHKYRKKYKKNIIINIMRNYARFLIHT